MKNRYYSSADDRRTYIGIDDIDKPIWRIFSVEHFKSFYKKKQIVLTNPRAWNDPFENILQKCKISGGPYARSPRNIKLTSAFTRFYGQCWTYRQSESDAMWRIYTPRNSYGVRVSCTPRLLLNAVASSIDVSGRHCFFGKVKYLTERNILQQLSHPEITKEIERQFSELILIALFGIDELEEAAPAIISTLLMKRTAFEMRLIYFLNEDRFKRSAKLLRLTVDPIPLFTKVIFDPRMPKKEYSNATQDLLDLGFRGTITCSSLYRIPKHVICIPSKEDTAEFEGTIGDVTLLCRDSAYF